MTKALQHAIELLGQLSAEKQDLLAGLLLHEIDEDERWAQSTASHAEKLRGFVNEVAKSDRCGECEVLDPDTL